MTAAGACRGPVGIIAGDGSLPVEAVRRARRWGPVAVVHVGKCPDARLQASADRFARARPDQWDEIGRFLQESGVQVVYLVGKVDQRVLFIARPDASAGAALGSLRARGDEALLRAVVRFLESRGLQVGSQVELMADLLVPAGNLTSHAPRRPEDVAIGLGAARAIGELDIGQTVVVADGVVVAVEAVEGTDAAIRRGGELAGPGATVVKVAKPFQDLRVEVPAVGLETLESALAAGVQTLALETGRVLLVDRDEFVSRAEEAGIAVLGVQLSEAGPEASFGCLGGDGFRGLEGRR